MFRADLVHFSHLIILYIGPIIKMYIRGILNRRDSANLQIACYGVSQLIRRV